MQWVCRGTLQYVYEKLTGRSKGKDIAASEGISRGKNLNMNQLYLFIDFCLTELQFQQELLNLLLSQYPKVFACMLLLTPVF